MQHENVYGLHAVARLLSTDASRVVRLHVLDRAAAGRIAEVASAAESQRIEISPLPRRELDRLSAGGRHQGVVAIVRAREPVGEDALRSLVGALTGPALVIVLDGVQDPHNLGAVLRTADAAGAHAVVAPKNRAASLTAAARKVASGAAETVPFVQVTNLARTLRWLREAGLWLIGTAEEAPGTLFDADLSQPLVLLLGGEERGLRRLTREHCDELVALPMHGAVESLNVSVAAGICLYEALRQRMAGARV